jgi:hypothetical protein
MKEKYRIHFKIFKGNKRILIVGISSILVASSLISAIGLFIYSINNIELKFVPDHIKSFPNHTAWLLVDIKQRNSYPLPKLEIEITCNESISMEFQIWNNTIYEKVIEIFLYPNITHIDTEIEITVELSNGQRDLKEFGYVNIINWTSTNIEEVKPMRDVFISYLALNYPNLGIDVCTRWIGFTNAPMTLVVEHFLFLSENWELELSRHVMIPPYDWVQGYIRPRSQISPIWAGKIDSWSDINHTVSEINPPPQIYR